MARYNAWQNNGLRDVLAEMNPSDLKQDRGVFFGLILGALNHLLWGDTLWMSRFDGSAGTDLSIAQSVDFTPKPAVWAADRFRIDARITLWAARLKAIDLVGDLTWFSGAANREMAKPKELCTAHFFNHQTHHRGQIHAMLTAAGQTAAATDLPFMPEDI
jgi:uncharacterized damage-inducible protein DinB